MSDQRLAWTDDEKKLLESTRRELPGATVKELTQVFNMSNHQFRTEVAVRQTLGRLGLSRQPRPTIRLPTITASLRDLSLPKKSSVKYRVSKKPVKFPGEKQICNRPVKPRYEWGVLELGIFLPIHPLLAEARQHAARPQTLRHGKDFCVELPWLSILENDTIAQLKCGKKDKLALQQYMDYLKDWKSR